MTLVNARAAFEKAVTDAVAAADNTVLMVYDNVAYTTPGKTKKYITMTISFTQSTLQNQGAASDYYSGVVQCNVYVPRSAGTSVLSSLSCMRDVSSWLFAASVLNALFSASNSFARVCRSSNSLRYLSWPDDE